MLSPPLSLPGRPLLSTVTPPVRAPAARTVEPLSGLCPPASPADRCTLRCPQRLQFNRLGLPRRPGLPNPSFEHSPPKDKPSIGSGAVGLERKLHKLTHRRDSDMLWVRVPARPANDVRAPVLAITSLLRSSMDISSLSSRTALFYALAPRFIAQIRRRLGHWRPLRRRRWCHPCLSRRSLWRLRRG